MNTTTAHRADQEAQPTLMLTLGEVAAHLRCTRRSIEREVARHHLHVVRIGRSVRVARRELSRYLTSLRDDDEGEAATPSRGDLFVEVPGNRRSLAPVRHDGSATR